MFVSLHRFQVFQRSRDLALGNQPIGLEAAHIQWHQTGGLDVDHNGLALCSLHHKAFDLGAFTIVPDQILLVSERTYGRSGFDEWLLRSHGQPIRKPLRASYLPGSDSSGLPTVGSLTSWLGTRGRCSSDRQGSWSGQGDKVSKQLRVVGIVWQPDAAAIQWLSSVPASITEQVSTDHPRMPAPMMAMLGRIRLHVIRSNRLYRS